QQTTTNPLTIPPPEHPPTLQYSIAKFNRWATIFPTTNISTSYIATINLDEL
ncbi:10248_t:CDS:2, partial [Ambispora leptoticha]